MNRENEIEDDNSSCHHMTGRIKNNVQTPHTNSSKVRAIECIASSALELFAHRSPYPSLTTNGYARITKEFFSDVLSQHFRSPKSIWGLSLNGESIRYYPWSGTKSMLSFFDIILGYDHGVYDVLFDGYLPMEQCFSVPDGRVSLDSVILTKQQSSSYVTAPVFWMNSNYDTLSNRSAYMKELMSPIAVDSWVIVVVTNDPNSHLKLPKLRVQVIILVILMVTDHRSKKAMINHYTFTVAIENSLELDYVTEKLWQPLVAGRIPLYYGASNVDDWLPCQDCIIDLRIFANAKAAAEFIMSFTNNTTLYTQFHKWRQQSLLPKFQQILDYFQRTNAYTLESLVCAMAHNHNPALQRYEILNDIGPLLGSHK